MPESEPGLEFLIMNNLIGVQKVSSYHRFLSVLFDSVQSRRPRPSSLTTTVIALGCAAFQTPSLTADAGTRDGN